MTPADFRAQLELELSWRTADLNALKGAVNAAPFGNQDDLRKSVVLVLYSHLEGFCIFALRHYVEAINAANLRCGEASPAVLAGAWEHLFKAVLHGDKKCEVFSHSLPNDDELHSHWRRRHFVEERDQLEAARLVLNEKIVNADSNLKPVVLQRNMFILGLDPSFVAAHKNLLNRFLGRRNNIAHGAERRGVPLKEYNEYESFVFLTCRDLIDLLCQAHAAEAYRKRPPAPFACG